MGEAIPEANQQPTSHVFRAPWWASRDFYLSSGAPWRSKWTWDPSTTEMIVGIERGNLTSVEQAREWTAKGYVLSSWHDTMDDFVLAA